MLPKSLDQEQQKVNFDRVLCRKQRDAFVPAQALVRIRYRCSRLSRCLLSLSLFVDPVVQAFTISAPPHKHVIKGAILRYVPHYLDGIELHAHSCRLGVSRLIGDRDETSHRRWSLFLHTPRQDWRATECQSCSRRPFSRTG